MANSAAGRSLSGIARAFAAVQSRIYPQNNQQIAGVDPKNWPTANQPVQPVGPPGSKPLNWGFWQGLNQNITPRPDASLSAEQLRDLATYPLARLLIENIKDQVSGVAWTVQLKETPGESLQDRRERQKKDPKIGQLINFMDAPDGETPWNEFIRPILEDLLVIDAPAILLRRSLTGKVLQWRGVDGSEILRLIDDQGWTPAPPSPAYTQLWEGVPRLFLTTDQLVYRPRNIVRGATVASQLYGQSPVQDQAEEIQIGRKRLQYVLSFYTDGAVPGIVQMVAPGTPVDKIVEGMQWMNSELAGNLAARRQWRMMQSFSGTPETGPKDQIEQLKEPVLANVYDDLHIRKLAFRFGASAQRLLKQMNRASAEASQQAAEEEGTQPWVTWLKGTIDICFQRMGYSQYEAVPKGSVELDPEKQSEIDDRNLKNGSTTIDAVRIARGEEPFGLPETSKPMIYLPTGIVPVEGSIDRTDEAHQAAIAPKPAPVIAPPSGNPKPGNGGPSKKKVATRLSIDPSRTSPRLAIAHAKAYTHVAHFLYEAGKTAAKVIEGNKTALRFAKADGPEDDEIEGIVDSIMGEIPWADLVGLVEPDLTAAAVEGGEVGVADLDAIGASISGDVISAVNEVARDYATERAAELVGMKYVDGELVENPNARWAITDSTRNMLRSTIADAFSKETTMADLTAAIRQAGAFSETRAQLIATTEISDAQMHGNAEAWVKSGVVELVAWVLSMDHEDMDICDELAEGGPYPIGDVFVLLFKKHPRCVCVLIAAKVKGVSL